MFLLRAWLLAGGTFFRFNSDPIESTTSTIATLEDRLSKLLQNVLLMLNVLGYLYYDLLTD